MKLHQQHSFYHITSFITIGDVSEAGRSLMSGFCRCQANFRYFWLILDKIIAQIDPRPFLIGTIFNNNISFNHLLLFQVIWVPYISHIQGSVLIIDFFTISDPRNRPNHKKCPPYPKNGFFFQKLFFLLSIIIKMEILSQVAIILWTSS